VSQGPDLRVCGLVVDLRDSMGTLVRSGESLDTFGADDGVGANNFATRGLVLPGGNVGLSSQGFFGLAPCGGCSQLFWHSDEPIGHWRDVSRAWEGHLAIWRGASIAKRQFAVRGVL